MKTITLSKSLDEAVDKLPFLRRRLWQRRLRRPANRKKVIEHLQVELMDDPRAEAMGVAPAIGAAAFNEDTPFEIAESQFQDFLDLILEYLPRILEMIMAFFVLLPFIMLALSFPTPEKAVAETRMSQQIESDSDFVPYTASELQADPIPRQQMNAPETTIIVSPNCEPDAGYEQMNDCASAEAACASLASAACAQPASPACSTAAQPASPNCRTYQTYSQAGCSTEGVRASSGAVAFRRAGPLQSRLSERPLMQRFRQRSGPLRRLFGARMLNSRCGR